MRHQLLVLAAAACLSAFGSAQDPTKKGEPARAPGRDAIQTLIRDGMLAYRKGDLKLSVEKLQQAIERIQDKRKGTKDKGKGTQDEGMSDLADYLPKVDGWKVGKPEVTSGSTGAGAAATKWTQVTANYTRIDGSDQVRVLISNSSMMADARRAGLAQAVTLMSRDPKKTVHPIKTGGWVGYRALERGKNAIGVAMTGNVLVVVEVPRPKMATLAAFWKSLDFSALRKASKGASKGGKKGAQKGAQKGKGKGKGKGE